MARLVPLIRQRDAREFAEQIVNPTGLHVLVDHSEQGDAEWALAHARREAARRGRANPTLPSSQFHPVRCAAARCGLASWL